MRTVFLAVPLLFYFYANPWGFFAHKSINYHACFTLPPEMFGFYKANIDQIKEMAIRPYQRRYLLEDEAPRHYIDIDKYENSLPIDTIPTNWDSAISIFGEAMLKVHGIIPWHIHLIKFRLTNAMKNHDYLQIIKLSADLGHYIGDAHVPLHTTQNYNGQLTNQHGIHGLWESRLPEIFSSDYVFLVGKAIYLDRPLEQIWKIIEDSHASKDSVLDLEQKLSSKMSHVKYAFEQRGATTVKVYNQEFSAAYHLALNGMVERRMKQAIHMTGSFWYTAWIDAGQPDLPFKQIEPKENGTSLDSLLHQTKNKIMGRMETH